MKYKTSILMLAMLGLMLTGCVKSTYHQGMESLENKDYTAAVQQFEEAVKEEKNVADSYRGIGIAYFEQQNYEEAVNAFQSALAQDAKETGALYNMLGVSYMYLEQYEEAIQAYETGIGFDDCTSEMLQEMRFNIISAYEKLEDWEQARQKLTEYVQDYPDDEVAKKEADFLETR